MRKGAYTGASEARAGKFEQAHGGTLLLDEITEMPLGLQAKLLRVLQEREVERLGASAPQHVDVRVLATSNRDLKRAVAEGTLREDLYYRLNVFPLRIPPLRERPADILPLARRLLEHHAPADAERLDVQRRRRGVHCCAITGRATCANSTTSCSALVFQDGGRIERDAIVLETAERVVPSDTAGSRPGAGLDVELRHREDQLILDALRAEDGRRKEAAERLGISPRTLRYKLARLRAEGLPIR